MTDDQPGIPQVRPGPIAWLQPAMKAAIEEVVSGDQGGDWRITTEWDYSEFACHRCAIVTGSSFSVFFKLGGDDDSVRQFEVELAKLRLLKERAGVLVPRPINIAAAPGGSLLIMEAVKAVARGAKEWGDIGLSLARIHRVRGQRFGFERDGFWGPLHQDNTPADDWATFFRDQRLLPLLETAARSGNLPPEMTGRVEKLLPRLPELCGPGVAPVLLHGDAQQNNFISATEGAFVIDPASFYGHPEWDLALVDAWQPVPDEVFKAYRQLLPADPGFAERRCLWRIPLYLAAVALEGAVHLNALDGCLRCYE